MSKRYALRCDYCGVFHKIEVESEVVRLEAFSAILYEIGEDGEPVQNLNSLSNPDERKEDDEVRSNETDIS